MYRKTILCLANSKKPYGRCVAGKELNGDTPSAWIRPVSRRPTHEISADERRYNDGTSADVLDIIEVPFVRAVPAGHQTENHLIAGSPWRKSRTATWKEVQAALDTVTGSLWLNGHSTHHGVNDKIPVAHLAGIEDSLKLVKVANIALDVAFEAGYQGGRGRRKVRATFTLDRRQYQLAVTDPIIENEYLAKEDKRYMIGPAILCISLSEPIYGHAFKLVATLLTKDRCDAA